MQSWMMCDVLSIPFIERCRSAYRNEWAVVHDERPLSEDFRLDDLASSGTKRKAMLIFFAPGPNDPKVMDRHQWNARLSKIAYQTCDQLHPKGTVVALVPQPYYDHATALAGGWTKRVFFLCKLGC